MHNGFVRLQDQKMSKSTGNVATIREPAQSATTPKSCASS